MPIIHKQYPHGLTTREIQASIREYAEAMTKAGGKIDQVLQFSPLIMLGQQELQTRTNRRVTGLSLGIAILSLLTSGAALYVSHASQAPGRHWELQELQALRQLRSALQHQTEQLYAASVETNRLLDAVLKELKAEEDVETENP
jgi:hypothetical protein